MQHPGYFKVLNTKLANYPEDTLPWDRGGDKGRPEIWTTANSERRAGQRTVGTERAAARCSRLVARQR